MIIVIDNYDSFIYNIVQYIGEIYPEINVYRNDKITVEEVLAMEPDGIVISPGPGRPDSAGISKELIRQCGDIPLFGVCLGHQSIAEVYGGEIIGATHIIHGKRSVITHDESGIFSNISNPVNGIRYHSLVANPENLPDILTVTATSDDNEIMGLKVKDKHIYGIQFHPESFLTDEGKSIIKNYVDIVMERRAARINRRIKEINLKVNSKQNLSSDEAYEMMNYIMMGDTTQAQMSGYLTSLSMKGETPDEISGSAKSMFEAANQVKTNVTPLVDTCGTGGDHSGTYNISTISAFIAAGAGVYIAKHGNRSLTSKSGSADVLEKLNINISTLKDEARLSIKYNGFSFLFAPLYHPAMKNVMPVRRQLGFRTIFNILGPIVNPAGVKRHVMGVFSEELLNIVPDVFLQLGHIHSLVLHAEIGLDEASIEGRTHIREIKDGSISEMFLDPADFGLDGKIANLKVEDSAQSAELIENILTGKETGDPWKAAVLNSALVIYVAKDVDLQTAIDLAKESVSSGKAWEVVQKVSQFTNCEVV